MMRCCISRAGLGAYQCDPVSHTGRFGGKKNSETCMKSRMIFHVLSLARNMELRDWKTWFFVWKTSNSSLKTNSSWILSTLSPHSQLSSLPDAHETDIHPAFSTSYPMASVGAEQGKPLTTSTCLPQHTALISLPLKCSIKIGGKDWQGLLKEAEYCKAKGSLCWALGCGNLHRRAKRERFSVTKHSGISWLGWGRSIWICCCWNGEFTNTVFQS